MEKLTLKQKKFADAYIASGNATQSFKDAGYSWKSPGAANSNASELLTNRKVKKYIENRMKELDDKAIAKQEEVLKYLTAVMRGEESEETLISKGESGQTITDIKVSAKDRLKAAELLGKRYALFTEKQEIDADTSLSIEVSYEDKDPGE